jgi:hypothetical protein
VSDGKGKELSTAKRSEGYNGDEKIGTIYQEKNLSQLTIHFYGHGWTGDRLFAYYLGCRGWQSPFPLCLKVSHPTENCTSRTCRHTFSRKKLVV